MFRIEVRLMGKFSMIGHADNIGEAFKQGEIYLLKGYRSVRVICPDGRIVTL